MSTTLERLDRVLAMVPWLLAHPGARIDDVAARFGTTPSEVAEDLDVLGYCGVPGYGGGDLVEVSFMGDCVVVRMADFFRRPLRLDVGEAVTLLLAGRALRAAPGVADAEALTRAVAKLEAALGAAEVAVDLGPADEELLALLQDAAADQRVLRIRYRSTGREEETTRDVEPWAVVAAGGSWYLRGHCRRAGAARDFRVDRIREATPTGERAERRSDAPPPPRWYEPSPEDLRVVLHVDDDAAWLANALPGADAPEAGTVRFPARSLEWAARLVLSLAGSARVAEPPALAERVRSLAAETARLYADDDTGDPASAGATD